MGKAGIGIDDFIAVINQRQDREEDNGLAAGDHDDFVAGDFHAAGAADVFGECLPQVGQAGGGAVVRPAFAQGVDAGIDHVCGRVEVGLTDFEMDDALALTLQGARFIQNFKGSLGAEARHAAG